MNNTLTKSWAAGGYLSVLADRLGLPNPDKGALCLAAGPVAQEAVQPEQPKPEQAFEDIYQHGVDLSPEQMHHAKEKAQRMLKYLAPEIFLEYWTDQAILKRNRYVY